MKRFKVATRETSYRTYYVDAESADAISIEGLDGDEYDYEFDMIDIEELQEFAEFVLDAATQPVTPSQD